MHLTCVFVCVCVCVRAFGQHHNSLYSICVSLRGSLPYMRQEWENEKEVVCVGWGWEGGNLGQIVEHADPLRRRTHVCILSLLVDRTACMFIHSQETGLQVEESVYKSKGCIKYVSLRNTSFFSTLKTLLCHWPVSSTPPPERERKKKEKKKILAHIEHTVFHIIPWSLSPYTILPLGLMHHCQQSQQPIRGMGGWHSYKL